MNISRRKTQNFERRKSWEHRIPKRGKILEIGSGGSPHPKSTILCDKYLTDKERSGSKLLIDRPFVIADGERLPFKDNEFDYSICTHVIEHSNNPALFLNELMRISKKGYIETPSILWEEMQPFREFHKWLIFSVDNKLIFKRKRTFQRKLKVAMQKLIFNSYEITLLRNAFKPVLNVSFEWETKIEYLINPENFDELLLKWTKEMSLKLDKLVKGGKRKAFIKHLVRFILKKFRRKLNMYFRHWLKY